MKYSSESSVVAMLDMWARRRLTLPGDFSFFQPLAKPREDRYNPSNFLSVCKGAVVMTTAVMEDFWDGVSARSYWLSVLERVAGPVLEALANERLKETMPVEYHPARGEAARNVCHLEAAGRTLMGIAPWLELEGVTGPEEELRARLAAWARAGISHGTNPNSADFLNFTTDGQPLVDAAFLAQAMLRAPRNLWGKLDESSQGRVIDALRSSRVITPGYNNWLLFSAIIEAFFCRIGETYDVLRIDYALRSFESFYFGDGAYGDGTHYRWDYYNSYVIQPMLVDILDALHDATDRWHGYEDAVYRRIRRYAAVQERLISPEGTFPCLGRSMCYRFGAFQALAQTALREALPAEIAPAQVRCGLTAVIRRMIEAPGTFDGAGWLRHGFCGYQPSLGEPYINTGSLYLCLAALLPLGLGPEASFWCDAGQPWSGLRAWSGEDIPSDHARD